MDECELRKAAGEGVLPCDGEDCVFWRLAGHLDLVERPDSGCAVQYFDLLGEGGSDVAAWLLSVKERVELLPQAGS